MDIHKQLNAETTTWLYEWYFRISNLSDLSLLILIHQKPFNPNRKVTETYAVSETKYVNRALLLVT